MRYEMEKWGDEHRTEDDVERREGDEETAPTGSDGKTPAQEGSAGD
jgi:hypothetical protein